ncbi:hypothetical protein SFC66_11575 [Terribacillus saccharophilus]|uniref:hypothetical protein n=1 Tax=Terribacillus saccharophilus TaxID=361277 RepID=UPI0039827842
MKKLLGSLIAGLLIVALAACGGEAEEKSKAWSGEYTVTQDRFDDSGMYYATVEVNNVDSEDSLNAFIETFKEENPKYTEGDSLFMRIDDGGDNWSSFKEANNQRGAAQTGLEANASETVYKD